MCVCVCVCVCVNFSWVGYIACSYKNMCMMNRVEYERKLPQKYC